MNSLEYQLSRKYMEKFCSICKLAARIVIIFQQIILVYTYLCVLMFTTVAYFDSEMNFSIVIMSIWFVILILSMYYAFSIGLIAGVYTYLVCLYMKYRFQQLQDLIEIYLKRVIYLKQFETLILIYIYISLIFMEYLNILH